MAKQYTLTRPDGTSEVLTGDFTTMQTIPVERFDEDGLGTGVFDDIEAEITHPFANLAVWSASDLAALGVSVTETVDVPERSTLSDWRVALIKMGRLNDVLTLVKAAKDSGTIEGQIAWERLEYANHVYRDELMQLAPVFGFSPSDVDESLTIAGED